MTGAELWLQVQAEAPEGVSVLPGRNGAGSEVCFRPVRLERWARVFGEALPRLMSYQCK